MQQKGIKDYTCADCAQVFPEWIHDESIGNYILAPNGSKICHKCTDEREKGTLMNLHIGKRVRMYLCGASANSVSTYGNKPDERVYVCGVTGAFKINVSWAKRSRHNIAGWRYDVWFCFQGKNFHAFQCGDMTQLCVVRRLK